MSRTLHKAKMHMLLLNIRKEHYPSVLRKANDSKIRIVLQDKLKFTGRLSLQSLSQQAKSHITNFVSQPFQTLNWEIQH
jgi:hypothetical protein